MSHDDWNKSEALKILLTAVTIALLVLCAFLMVINFAGCATKPEVTARKAVNCAARSVGSSWTRAYPEVMRCLTVVMVDPVECLDAVPAMVKVGVDTVACIVRDTAKVASMRVQGYGDDADAVTVRKAERSREYLTRQGFTFAE